MCILLPSLSGANPFLPLSNTNLPSHSIFTMCDFVADCKDTISKQMSVEGMHRLIPVCHAGGKIKNVAQYTSTGPSVRKKDHLLLS